MSKTVQAPAWESKVEKLDVEISTSLGKVEDPP